MLKTHIADGTGTDILTKVTDQNALLTTQVGYPPVLPVNKTSIYRAFLANSAGATDMRVDGSVTPVEFFVQATTGADRYITQVSFEIADAAMVHNEFGHLAALANGCTLTYQKVGRTITIHDALKSNWDFIRLCLGYPAFGATTNAFIASNVAGASEGMIPTLDFTKLLPPYGLKLDTNSVQRLVLTVRDNVSGVDAFNAIAYGFDREE